MSYREHPINKCHSSVHCKRNDPSKWVLDTLSSEISENDREFNLSTIADPNPHVTSSKVSRRHLLTRPGNSG